MSESNCLIEARYFLKLNPKKFILACISKCDSRHKIAKEMSLSAVEFEKFTGISNARQELYKAVDDLYDATILLQDPDNDVYTEHRWIQRKTIINRGKAEVTILWSDDIIKYISQLTKEFTSYKLKNVGRMESVHTIRLYELVIRFKNTDQKQRDILVEDLKLALGIGGKYSQFMHLNHRILKPAVEEINKKTDIDLQIQYIKRDRKVEKLRLMFEMK